MNPMSDRRPSGSHRHELPYPVEAHPLGRLGRQELVAAVAAPESLPERPTSSGGSEANPAGRHRGKSHPENTALSMSEPRARIFATTFRIARASLNCGCTCLLHSPDDQPPAEV